MTGEMPSADIAVSVVIPTHNRRDLIAAAVHTATEQDHPPKEIIIVDDASTDGTEEAVAALAPTTVPVTYIRLERNRGGGFARNVGAQAAKGTFVAFLDSDDHWTPDYLSRALRAAATEPDDNFVISARTTAGDRILPPTPMPAGLSNVQLKDYVLFQNLAFQTSTLVMPRTTALSWPFDGRLRRHQDWDLIFRMISGGVRLRQTPEPTVFYNLDPSGKVSKSRAPGPSRRFLARHRAGMSARARQRLWLLEIRQRKAQGASVVDLVTSALIGGITLFELRHYVVQKLLSRSAPPKAD